MFRARCLKLSLIDSILLFGHLNLAPVVSSLRHGCVDRRQRFVDESQLIGQRQRTAKRQADYALQVQAGLFRISLGLRQTDLLLSQARLSASNIDSSGDARVALILSELQECLGQLDVRLCGNYRTIST